MENETDIKLESLTEDELKTIIKERDEAKNLVKQKEEGLNNVVEELKEMRQKKAELEEKLKQGTDGQPSVEEVVTHKLREAELQKQEEERKLAHQRAKDKFLAEHKEFLPENDSSGIRMAALEKKLQRFNLSAATSEEDVIGIFNDALELLSRSGGSSDFSGGNTPPPASGGSSRYEGVGSLTAKELGVIQRLGWTREKYLQTKAKHPDLVSDLFK